MKALAATTLLALGFFASAQAQVVRPLVDLSGEDVVSYAIDDAGTVVYAVSTSNQFGTNPSLAKQLFKWDPVSGAGSQLTFTDEGVETVSVSDDGQWLAVVSRSNFLGTNHDESLEVFLLQGNGTPAGQLTNDTSFAGDGVRNAVISGSGNRVIFVSDTDPLGANPGREAHLFAVNTDGTGLIQLADVGAAGFVATNVIAVSDDGDKIAFIEGQDEYYNEVYAIRADGSDLHQLTTDTYGHSVVALSGNGDKVVYNFFGPGLYFTVGWDGTGTSAGFGAGGDIYPISITDDAQWVFFRSSAPAGIVKSAPDGSGATLVAADSPPSRLDGPVVSGSGNRLAALVLSSERELLAMDSSGGGTQQLTNLTLAPRSGTGDVFMLPNGRIYFSSFDDLVGLNPEHVYEMFTILPDGTGLAQVTNFGIEWFDYNFWVSDAGTVVFSTRANLLGTSSCVSQQCYKMNTNGTGLTQLTFGCGSPLQWVCWYPRIRFDSGSIVYISNELGDGLYKMTNTGGSRTNLSNEFAAPTHMLSGQSPSTWIAYESDGNADGQNPNHRTQIFRINISGSSKTRITADPDYGTSNPLISGDGNKIVWASQADYLGTNPDHSYEIFLQDIALGTRRQLTDSTTANGYSYPTWFNRDGTWVFAQTSEGLVRISVATGAQERLTGFESRHGYGGSADSPGNRFVFSGQDIIGRSPTGGSLFLADQTAKPAFNIGVAAPTALSWEPDPQSVRYDAIRGNLANLSADATTVQLGPVACIEDDSPDSHTRGFDDAVQPAPGQGFFYLYRGTTGIPAVTGTYGQGSGGKTRVAGAGGCAP